MKFSFNLTYPVQGGNYEGQLKRFCLDNKFGFSGVKFHEFADNTHTVWLSIQWKKNKKNFGGQQLYQANGAPLIEDVPLVSKIQVYGPEIPLDAAKEDICYSVLREMFSKISLLYKPEYQQLVMTTTQPIIQPPYPILQVSDYKQVLHQSDQGEHV